MSKEDMKTRESSSWAEKYRPQDFDSIIAPQNLHTFLDSVKKDGEVPNMIFTGPAGTGKTSTAIAIAEEIGANYLYVDASSETSIDNIRYNVRSFATTKSLFNADKKKIAILDEFDRLSDGAMDSLKGLIQETDSVCRYIFTTNNIHKVKAPVISRCSVFTFGTNQEEKKELISQYFRRAKAVLDNEGVEYEKEVLAKFVKKLYPDFRKILLDLQKCHKSHGVIDGNVFQLTDEAVIKDLVTEMKNMRFNNIRKIATTLDPNSFYTAFYADIDQYLKRDCIPDVVVLLAQYAGMDGTTIDREINMVGCLTEIAKVAKWA